VHQIYKNFSVVEVLARSSSRIPFAPGRARQRLPAFWHLHLAHLNRFMASFTGSISEADKLSMRPLVVQTQSVDVKRKAALLAPWNLQMNGSP
jgi:hypothetical protein